MNIILEIVEFSRIDWINIVDITVMISLFTIAFMLWRFNGIFARKVGILLTGIAIEILFAIISIRLDRNNLEFIISKISGRLITFGFVIWFLFYITKKEKKVGVKGV